MIKFLLYIIIRLFTMNNVRFIVLYQLELRSILTLFVIDKTKKIVFIFRHDEILAHVVDGPGAFVLNTYIFLLTLTDHLLRSTIINVFCNIELYSVYASLENGLSYLVTQVMFFCIK